MDPLLRIQEEIKEVVRREEEYRQLNSIIGGHSDRYEDAENNNIDKNVDAHEDILSLTSSVNSKESLDGINSDDSGISASPSPPNGTLTINTNTKNVDNTTTIINGSNKEKRYIGPNCYNLTPEPPQQKLMSRSISLQQLSATKPRPLNINPAHKGVMQRFIASRGKLQLNGNNTNNALLKLANSPVNANDRSLPPITLSSNSLISAINASLITDHIGIENQKAIIIPTTTLTSSSNIERDAGGKPIRPGYVPVEEKIQRELKDIKTREKELKQIRKIRQSTSDLLESIEKEILESDDDNDSDVEHCYGPGKLRTAKSIGQLYDSAQFNDSTSPRLTPSPDYDRKLNLSRNGNNGMRPAMSLAQLCNLDPEDTPSSHRLIAQWESLIQQNA